MRDGAQREFATYLLGNRRIVAIDSVRLVCDGEKVGEFAAVAVLRLLGWTIKAVRLYCAEHKPSLLSCTVHHHVYYLFITSFWASTARTCVCVHRTQASFCIIFMRMRELGQ